MKKSIYLFAAGMALTASSLISCNSSKPVDLKLNLQPGAKFQYTTVTRQNITQQAMGQTMKLDQEITMASNYVVGTAEGTNKKITVTYDHIAMKTSTQGMSLNYDSKDSANQDPRLKYMGSMINKPFSVVLTPKGEVVSIGGLQDIVNGILSDSAMVAAKEMLQQQFNDSIVRSMMQQSFNIYPEKPVRTGDTWKRTFNMLGMVSMEIANTYKLVSVKGDVAHIDVDSKITGKPAANPALDMQVDMSGIQKGSMDVEVSTGMITESKMQQSLKGKVKARGMEIPMELKSDIQITGKKL